MLTSALHAEVTFQLVVAFLPSIGGKFQITMQVDCMTAQHRGRTIKE